MSNIQWYDLKMTSNSLPAPYKVSASSEFNSTMQIWQAFNGITIEPSLGWMSTNTNASEWIVMDFGVSKRIDRIAITARTNSPSSTISNFILMGSNNGVDYESIKSFSLTSWSSNETKEIEFSAVNFRYIKFQISKDSTTSYASVAEIVFGLINNKAILKNPTTNQYYSLAEKTLIPLSDSSDKNMNLHGIEAGEEIHLDEAFDKIDYPVESDLKSIVKTMVKPLSIKLNNIERE